MSSPIIWGPSGSKFIGSPQGASGDVLTNDGSGNLSWAPAGTGGPTTFTLADGQASFANITGFSVNPSTSKAFTAETSTYRYHTGVTVANISSNFTFGANNNVFALATSSTGDVYLGGQFTDVGGNAAGRIAKTDADGNLIFTFLSFTGAGFNSDVNALAVQSDGKIVVGGSFTSFNGNTRGKLVRLNSDGSEDTTFATNVGTAVNTAVYSIKIQSTGKILIAGQITDFNGTTVNNLVRLNTDGTLDTTFLTNLGTGFNDYTTALEIQADDKILVGGNFTSFNGGTTARFIRLNSDGTEDTTFSTSIGIGFNDIVWAIYYQTDTKMLLGGDFTNFNGSVRNRLIRLNSDGSEDTAFYSGLAQVPSATVFAITIAGTGVIVVGGSFTGTYDYIMALNDDASFNTALSAALVGGADVAVRALATQPSGQVVVGGQFSQIGGQSRPYIGQLYSIVDFEYVSQDTIKGVFHQSTGVWTITNAVSLGDATGVSLQMTNAGQLQYETTSIGGTLVTSEFKFTIVSL